MGRICSHGRFLVGHGLLELLVVVDALDVRLLNLYLELGKLIFRRCLRRRQSFVLILEDADMRDEVFLVLRLADVLHFVGLELRVAEVLVLDLDASALSKLNRWGLLKLIKIR